MLPVRFRGCTVYRFEDLVTHLHTSNARYRSALPAKFLDRNPSHPLPPPPDVPLVALLAHPSLRGVPPTPLPPPTLAAAVDILGAEDVGAASALSGKRRSSKGKGGKSGGGGSGGGGGVGSGGGGGGGGGGSGGSGGGVGSSVEAVVVAVGVGVAVVAAVGVVAAAVVAIEVELFRGEVLTRGASGGSFCCTYVIRTGDRAGQTCGKLHTQHRYFSCLDDARRAEFGDEAERPCWAELLSSGVDIFAVDYDAILAALYALSLSAEGDCYLCVLPDPSIEVAALGASESPLPGTTPVEALYTFTLDSGASHCSFRDSTTLTPIPAPVPAGLADLSRGPVLARSSTVLPCPTVLSGSLLFCGTTALVTPPCLAFVACTPVSLSLVFPGLCLPFRPCLPRPAFLASRGGSAPLLIPSRFPRRLLPFRLSPFDDSSLTSAASGGATSRGAEPARAEPGGAEPAGVEPGGAESEGAESGGAVPGGAQPGGIEPKGAEPGGHAGASPRLSPRREPLSPQQMCEWFAQCTRFRSGAARAEGSATGGSGAGGTRATSLGGAGVIAGAGGTGGAGAAGPGGARTRGTGAAKAGGVGGAGAGDHVAGDPRAGGAGAGGPGVGDTGAGGTGAGGAGAGGPGVGDTGAGGTGAGGSGVGGTGPGGARAGGSGAGGPGAGGTGAGDPGAGGASAGDSSSERCEPASRPASLVRAVRTGRRCPRMCPPPVLGTHVMALRPSSVPLRVPLPSPPMSSLPGIPDPESDLARAASPTVPRLLATVVTDPSFESTGVSALVAELVDFAAACCLDYAASLVAESESECPPSIGGECDLGTDVLEDEQEDFECLAAAAITGPHSSQWQTAMDIEMASWKSTRTCVDAVPLSGANIVDGMWIFRVKRPPGSPPVFKARYVARGFSQREGVDFFHTFSPTPKMTTLWVLPHVAAQRDYELHSLDFSTAFLQGNQHEEIWLRHPSGFTRSFFAGTQWSQRPVYGLRQAPCEWHDTLRTTLAALGFAPSTADPSLFLRNDTSLPPFYVLVYVDDLVFATANTEALTLVKSELKKRHTCTDLGPSALRLPVLLAIVHSSAYWSLALSSTFGRAYLLSILARYVAPGRHRPEHWEAAKRVLRYLCSTSGMGLVLGGRGPVVLTGHADASWVDDSATQRSSSREAKIYAVAMAAQELRWLTYLLTDLGERPRSSPNLYVDNKAMIALCQEHRLEHKTKHITLRYFLARELQHRGQLRLAYVASRANTADIFTKALQSGDHQRFCTVLGLVPTLPHLLTE
ncbi:unnamed protein product [Closterium sp. NIES-53]